MCSRVVTVQQNRTTEHTDTAMRVRSRRALSADEQVRQVLRGPCGASWCRRYSGLRQCLPVPLASGHPLRGGDGRLQGVPCRILGPAPFNAIEDIHDTLYPTKHETGASEEFTEY